MKKKLKDCGRPNDWTPSLKTTGIYEKRYLYVQRSTVDYQWVIIFFIMCSMSRKRMLLLN